MRQAEHTDGRWRDGEILDVAAVLLLVQATVALMTSVGFFIWAIATGLLPVLVLNAVLEAGKPVLLIVLATSIVRRRRWARRWAVAYEALALAGLAANLLGGLLPVVQVGVSLVMIVTSAALPIALIAMLMSPSARQATEPQHGRDGAFGRDRQPQTARYRAGAAVGTVSAATLGGE